jgi:large subunit ribosomal protein L15
VISTKYYDLDCLQAISDPLRFFRSGKPIPRNGTPPVNAIEFYTSPENRGYLSDPDLIRFERLKLAQKYGYELKDLKNDPLKDVLSMKKDPRQTWYGLEPGWVVNFKEKCILKPTDPEYVKFYSS